MAAVKEKSARLAGCALLIYWIWDVQDTNPPPFVLKPCSHLIIVCQYRYLRGLDPLDGGGWGGGDFGSLQHPATEMQLMTADCSVMRGRIKTTPALCLS